MTNLLKKEFIIKYNINNTPNIKHFKNDDERIRRKAVEKDEHSINKVDMEKSRHKVTKI